MPRTAKAYILYRDERARERQERARLSALPTGNIPWRKVWEVLDWAVEHDLHTVERLNGRIARGELDEIIRETDRAYNEDITTASEMIRERRDGLRLVIVAGPSSSGKTTTTIKLTHLLTKMGLKLAPLTVDHYFFDLELHPKDEYGDYDFETPAGARPGAHQRAPEAPDCRPGGAHPILRLQDRQAHQRPHAHADRTGRGHSD